MITAQNGQPIEIGSYVTVICKITAITPASLDGVALLTLSPKYSKPNAAAPDDITTVYANQVFLAE